MSAAPVTHGQICAPAARKKLSFLAATNKYLPGVGQLNTLLVSLEYCESKAIFQLNDLLT
jgi:hypothetical protein